MDNKKNIGSPDSDRINVNEAYEVIYWTEKFNISAERLREAVGQVGTSVKAVENFLRVK